MRLKSKNILGVEITVEKRENILEEIRKYLKNGKFPGANSPKKDLKPLIIFTPNPEIIYFAQNSPFYREIVNSAQIKIPDGSGVVWALKKLYDVKVRRIAGVDFLKNLVSLAAQKRYRIGLIGGRHNLAVEVRECLMKEHKNLKIEVLEEPEVRIKNNELRIMNHNSKYAIHNSENEINKTEIYFQNLAKEIVKRKIDILFVALGFPKQEYFINRIKNNELRIKNKRPLVMMAVGGSFDLLAGRIPRASASFIRVFGSEWLYRLILEPWRLKRHIIGSRFFLRVLQRSFDSSR